MRSGPRLTESNSALSTTETQSSASKPVSRSKKLSVIVVDDDDTVRALVRALLTAEADINVLADAANGKEAVDLVSKCQPNIVIMDLDMPVLDGISATRELLKSSPDSKVLMYSANRDPMTVQRAMDAGVARYLFKPATRRILIEAVRELTRGKPAISERTEAFVAHP